VYTYRNPKSSPGVFQIADMQSTSLFVLDAESIATLAIVVNRTEAVPRLRCVHKQSVSLRVIIGLCMTDFLCFQREGGADEGSAGEGLG
jgi:hypothetical protein